MPARHGVGCAEEVVAVWYARLPVAGRTDPAALVEATRAAALPPARPPAVLGVELALGCWGVVQGWDQVLASSELV